MFQTLAGKAGTGRWLWLVSLGSRGLSAGHVPWLSCSPYRGGDGLQTGQLLLESQLAGVPGIEPRGL